MCTMPTRSGANISQSTSFKRRRSRAPSSRHELCERNKSRPQLPDVIDTYRLRPTGSPLRCKPQRTLRLRGVFASVSIDESVTSNGFQGLRRAYSEVRLMSSCLRLISRLSNTTCVNFGSSRPAMRPPLSRIRWAISLKLWNGVSGHMVSNMTGERGKTDRFSISASFLALTGRPSSRALLGESK